MVLKPALLLYLSINSSYFQEDGCGNDMICRDYTRALNDARYPTQSKVYANLTAITPENSSLIRDSNGRVLLSFYRDFYQTPSPGLNFSIPFDMRFTLAPDLQNFCSSYSGEDLSLRLKQLLGLNPSINYDGILEVWANPMDISRICPDPEISDTECQLSIPFSTKERSNSYNSPPWYCPSYTENAHQVSEKYLKVSTAHLRKLCNMWESAYSSENLYGNYPLTSLGYTYDWGDTKKHVGLSEFLLLKGTEVTLKGKYSIDEYCR